MKESELAEIFINYFNDGYEVYPEVPCGGGIVDFVATDGTIFIGCEVKRNFGFTVLEQAVRRAHCFHYTYICVPHRKGYRWRAALAKRERGIGTLALLKPYEEWSRISEIEAPKLNRKAYPPELKEYMKASVAGSQSDRVTAFGNTVNQIKTILKRRGEMHIDDVLSDINYHYSSLSSAKSSLRKWINSGVIEGVSWDRGILSLKEGES